MSLHIGYLLEKLYLIDQQLGGTAKSTSNKGDDFTSFKDAIYKKLHQLRAKAEQKQINSTKARDTDGIKLDIEIKDLIQEIEGILNKMNDALRKQSKDKKKYNQQNIEAKQKVYGNLRQQFYDVQQLLDPNAGVSAGGNNETLSDLKNKLMGDDVRRPPPPREATQQEKDAMDRWKQNDLLMDKQLDVILVGTTQWVANAQKIGDQIDHTMMQIEKLDKEVDVTNAELIKQNTQLKAIVEKYRQPDKFCMDIVLVDQLV
ncbi:hypothetical protein pb186bvf_013178 [Paramecium bursaria]